MKIEMKSNNLPLNLDGSDKGTITTVPNSNKVMDSTSNPLPNSLTSHISGNEDQSNPAKANLGTLVGVFLPTVQHIFGVIMFLRLFWIVGCMGLYQAISMLCLCCLCTFLTTISTSAIATNGKVEGAGAYYMISRNLGAAVGCAVGLLFYVANAAACAMYLVGSVEIFLLYLAPPSATVGGVAAHHSHGIGGMLSHNLRLYGTVLLLIQFVIVACGVKVVQFFAPCTLFCVIVSILSIYAGTVNKSLTNSGPYICLLDNKLLKRDSFVPHQFTSTDQSVCLFCNHSFPLLMENFCNNSLKEECTDNYYSLPLECKSGMPGFSTKLLGNNLYSSYHNELPRRKNPDSVGNKLHVVQHERTSFWILLSIFYPSVTGIMTGTNMAGDLRDSQKSIPIGTIAAQLTTSLVYASFVIIFSGSIEGDLLRDKWGTSLGGRMVVSQLIWPTDWILLIGSFTSTFGAALQCLCSAPRLLQTIAVDQVLPHMQGVARTTRFNEPFAALVVTAILSFSAIMIGVLDYIAPLVELFFLICYAFVNLACTLAALLKAPNWRPRFRFYHWSISLTGFCLCIFIMFATSWVYTLGALTIGSLIFGLVHWVGDEKEWGDGFTGLCLDMVHFLLQKVHEPVHVKNWRPQLLVLLDSKMKFEGSSRNRLFYLCHQLKKGQGFTLVLDLCNPKHHTEQELEMKMHQQLLQKDLVQICPTAFNVSLACKDDALDTAIDAAVQTVGVGAFRPNTIILLWNPYSYNRFIKMFHNGSLMEKCLLVIKGITHFPTPVQRLTGYIDVWWVIEDGGLLLLLAFLLRRHRVWKGCSLRLFAVIRESNISVNEFKVNILKWLYQVRIDAKVEIVILDQQKAYGLQNKYRPHKTSSPQYDHDFKDTEKHEEEGAMTLQLKCVQKLNAIIFRCQTNSQLTIVNLPEPPVFREHMQQYMSCVEELTRDITRVILARGSGSELITMYS